ncbi:GEVED domain-containing protein [Flavobacteriaceae bacterium]|nr:GEVED domain-containing protein [Flavobacteriaceae bacterium]
MRYLLLGIFLFSFNIILAQDWKQMMDDPRYNIYEVAEVAEAYFENIDKNKKGSGWKKFQRWLFENEPKFYPSGDRASRDPHYASNAFKDFLKKNPSAQKSIFDDDWEELGPYYIEEVTGHYAVGLGRVESFYIDDDPNIIYLGSRSGGFWKTTNGGESWSNTTDDLIATGVNSIAVNPNDSNKILINIRNSNNGTTHGIYQSIDAGETWTLTNFNPENLNWGGLGTNDRINLIKYHPTIPELVFIGTSKGLYRSSDNLITWNLVGQPWDNFGQIDFHPTNSSIIYTSKTNNDSNIYLSSDGGITFNASGLIEGFNNGNIITNNSNIKISISNDCENCIYIGSSDGIWKSSDLGETFELISGSYIDEISNYGAFAVSDINSSVILYGDIDTHMSFDEGSNFEKTTFWSQGNSTYDQTGTYVHADLRGAVCINGVFWVNTDGLLCKSEDNGITWEIFEGQSIRENYNLGVSQSNHYRTISGSQDNGTSIKTENSWIEFYGADGMEGIIHPLNDDWMIGSVQFGGKRRTKDGGYTQDGAGNVENGAWIAPLFYDANDQMKIYSLGDKVTVSEDFGSTWIDLGTPFGLTQSINYATIAENNSNIIAVTRGSQIKLSTDGGLTFSSINSNLPDNYITDVVFDPNNDDVIIVTYGTYNGNNNKVYVSNNQGNTWQNITYNLGYLPVRSVVIDHTANSNIYIGTEIGVYKKAMSNNVWELYSQGLPHMSILELDIVYGSNTLRAATWGRGLWEYSLDGRLDYPSILTTEITNPPTDNSPKVGFDQFVTSVIDYNTDLTDVYLKWSIDEPIFDNIISMSNANDNTWVSDTSIPNQEDGVKVYFKVFAEGNNEDITETYKYMYEVKANIYCTPSMDCSYGDGLQLFQLSTIDNPSECEGYGDFTNLSADLEQGTEYSLTVTTGYGSQYLNVWIDFNDDLEFSQDELIVDGYVIAMDEAAGSFTETINVTIAENASLGSHLMRAKTNWSGPVPADSCVETTYGETEDYMVNIIESSLNINEFIHDKIKLYPNPTSGVFTIDLGNYNKNSDIFIHDLNGRLIKFLNSSNESILNIDIKLTSGLYFVTVLSDKNKSIFKLLKK